MNVALNTATLIPRNVADTINGDALSKLVRVYNMSNAIIMHLPRIIDRALLTAIMSGVILELSTAKAVETCSANLADTIGDPAVKVGVRSDDLTDKLALIIQRMHHDNVGAIDACVDGVDYAVLANAAATFKGLIGEGASVHNGKGDRMNESAVVDFHHAMDWLRVEAERAVSKQRYKSLGEMNQSQL